MISQSPVTGVFESTCAVIFGVFGSAVSACLPLSHADKKNSAISNPQICGNISPSLAQRFNRILFHVDGLLLREDLIGDGGIQLRLLEANLQPLLLLRRLHENPRWKKP